MAGVNNLLFQPGSNLLCLQYSILGFNGKILVRHTRCLVLLIPPQISFQLYNPVILSCFLLDFMPLSANLALLL
jgi:hypothetical protein